MLDVVFYQSNQELFDKLSADQSSQIICPSPLIADNLRLSLAHKDITTISKWVSDRLKSMGLVKTRKSDLLLNLAAIWHHYFPDHHSSKFMEAFELFTELRSFTLSLDLLSEFFKELEEDMVKSILILWTYVEQEKFIDEQLSYERVSQEALSHDLIFVGFKHMNGVQIDMLKALSEKQDVRVYFPEAVYHEALPGDWIKWLEKDAWPQVLDNSNFKLKVIIPLKGKTNEAIKHFFDSNEHDLVLATSSAKFFQIQEVHQPGAFFKTSEDLFLVSVEKMNEALKSFIGRDSSSENIIVRLEKLKNSSLAEADYKFAKVIELTISALNVFFPLQNRFNNFAIDIVSEVVRLNVPRTSVIALERSIKRNIIDLNSLSLFSSTKPCAVLANQGMGGFKRSEKILNEAMSKALRSIGPLKRTTFEFSFFKYDLIAILKKPETVLFIDQELLNADLSWREILKSFELDSGQDIINIGETRKVDHISEKMKVGPFARSHYSASTLQTFIDCPRKYYFNFLDKIESKPDLNSSLEPAQLGNLEHTVIARYFENSINLTNEVNLELHRQICRNIFDELYQDRGLNLNKTVNAKSYLEVLHYSLNGIVFLIDFMTRSKGIGIEFEKPLGENQWNFKGSIDCIITLADNQIAVFDFKRSAGAAGTKFDTENFNKVQIWIYLLDQVGAGKSIHSFGYINLSDLSDEKLLYEAEVAQKILSSSLDSARDSLEKNISALNNSIDFEPNPRDEKVCHYCPINLFCHRGNAS